ncbi:hypothetical protein [Myroides guanonis]|uniref:Uncharacterized protein n=1 Tax=Myroides guanonis TaxID=1150112 RepID=A0A1I3TNK0_9FLAO|nr:hypothetical protein [Myroides guanonis]SFJ72053.1 hypothetical protein SAMN04487893_11437 [Myroides guanonis]
MRIYIGLLISLLLIMNSCKDNTKELQENQIRLQEHNDSVFKVLNEKWNFRMPAVSSAVSEEIKDWKQWSEFSDELKFKPVSSIVAFQKKTEKLNSILSALPGSLPTEFEQPEIRARFTVLINTFNFIDMYLRIDPVPIKEIDVLLPQVNKQITSISQKMDEIMTKKSIPKEMGEEEMLRALDTIRHANPMLQTSQLSQTHPSLRMKPVPLADPAIQKRLQQQSKAILKSDSSSSDTK